MIPTTALELRDQILTEAHARGVPLEQEGLALEQELPVLRLRVGGLVLRSTRVRLPSGKWLASPSPDVITVHGSGVRASKMWPRKLDGTFNIGAVVEHLLALVNEELSRLAPDLQVAVGVPTAASGLHVLHAAAIYLGTVPTGMTPADLLARVLDDRARERIKTHAGRAGLTDGDLRALSAAGGMFFGRAMKIDFDPFERISDRHMTVLRIGELKGERVERRCVLVLDRRVHDITVADPSGGGVVVMKRRK